MELDKHICTQLVEKAKAFTQITLDDDYIIRDNKPDVVRMAPEPWGCHGSSQTSPRLAALPPWPSSALNGRSLNPGPLGPILGSSHSLY